MTTPLSAHGLLWASRTRPKHRPPVDFAVEAAASLVACRVATQWRQSLAAELGVSVEELPGAGGLLRQLRNLVATELERRPALHAATQRAARIRPDPLT